MEITREPSLCAATAAASGNDAAAIAVVRSARFRKERARAKRKKRRALHQAARTLAPAHKQAATPIPATTRRPSAVVATSTPTAPSRTTAPSLATILVPATTSAPKPATASSPTKVPTLSVNPILSIIGVPSPTTTSSLATTTTPTAVLFPRSTLSSASTPSFTTTSSPVTAPKSSTKYTVATEIVLSPVFPPSCQTTSPCTGGMPISANRNVTFKKEGSSICAATRAAERKKRIVLQRTFVLPNQATTPNPATMPAAVNRADVISLPNTPSPDVMPTIAATGQPNTANWPTTQSNEDDALREQRQQAGAAGSGSCGLGRGRAQSGAARRAWEERRRPVAAAAGDDDGDGNKLGEWPTALGDDVTATAVVHATRFREERARSSGATRAAEHKKRRPLHQTAMAAGPVVLHQIRLPCLFRQHAYSGSHKSMPGARNQHAAAPSQIAAPNLAIILVPAATRATRPAAASSPTKCSVAS
uniref:Uncharacterized protein n=1 Tax=Oryza rufipogon TaxID=4529 RepID=A0A0E0RGK7_ORYRU